MMLNIYIYIYIYKAQRKNASFYGQQSIKIVAFLGITLGRTENNQEQNDLTQEQKTVADKSDQDLTIHDVVSPTVCQKLLCDIHSLKLREMDVTQRMEAKNYIQTHYLLQLYALRII